MNTAVFTLNRTGSSPENTESPFELWHLKKPDINLFKIFESKVAAHILKKKRLKFDAKSREEIIVGYSETTTGYRIYFLDRKKVEILKDIILLQDKKDTKRKNEISISKEKETENNIYEARK